MDREKQISAIVSRATSDMLERHVRASGVKKGHLVEQALHHYLVALESLPADAIVNPRLVVAQRVGKLILAQARSGKPKKALRDLMRNGN
jgi:hypothetical protein